MMSYALDERQRGLMVEVLPLAAYRLMRLGEPTDGFPSAVAPLLPPRYPALALRQVPLRLLVAAGVVDHRPVGQRREGLQTEINAGFLARLRERAYRHIRTRERDLPAIGLLGDRDGLGSTFNRTAPMHTDAPDFREHQDAV